jgi:hypothetical protein
MKALLGELERKHPTLRQTMLAALGNVSPSHLYDRKLRAVENAPGADDGVVPIRAVRG